MINRERAIGLSDEFRSRFQKGVTESQAWAQLRAEEPDANVFERRRILARAKQCLAIFHDVSGGDPPGTLNVMYPLPPSTEPAMPYMLETVWRVHLDVMGEIKPRMLVIVSPNGSLWASVLDDLLEGLIDMTSDYDAEDDPDVDFILIR